MQFKEYQQRVLDTLDAYLAELVQQRDKAAKIAAANVGETDPDLLRPVPNFPLKAWEAVKAKGMLPAHRATLAYSPRRTGDGQDVPNVTLKVPTGGGKTLLAAASVGRIMNSYLRANTGLVLWIVPNEAIYTQTRKHLTDRDHPYRQMLDRAAAGRVKILHKESPLTRADVEGNLCVLLLMLQSANRQTKATLRLFRDRGNVHGFTPPEGAADAHQALMAKVPNLDVYADVTIGYPLVKDSLGNVLRMLRPVVVMDEGHTAFARLAYDTLYGFNPSFVLELSATPRDGDKRWANWLVDVRGTDLDAEEMIKMPINLVVHGGDDWRDCLRQSWERTQSLQRAADELQSDSARYVRPILLVQVERTGKEQREAGCIHAEDVREFLLTLGLSEAAIAIKTAEVNDLKDPERQDLLSPTNEVRVIITKQALQEGWDCPFAYTLCSLAASSNMSAMTQLLGRILRQPHAQKIALETVAPEVNERLQVLNECYVHCFHARTGDVVQGIKRALEQDGMGDLAGRVKVDDTGEGMGPAGMSVTRERRAPFAGARIFLPRVLSVRDGRARLLDWESDILYAVEWSEVDLDALVDRLNAGGQAPTTYTARLGMEIIAETAGNYKVHAAPVEEPHFDQVYATRAILDLVPNPWLGREIIGRLLDALKQRGWSDHKLGEIGSFLIEELRKHLVSERDRLAEAFFRREVAAGRIQFRLLTDALAWELPRKEDVTLPEQPRQMLRPHDGRVVERSLMEPMYEHELNGLEFTVACYLDGQAALSWWYRNVVSGYALQGWRKNRVYPDLVFALQTQDGIKRLVALETKGDQLAGNLDTGYKRKLMDLLTDTYRAAQLQPIGTLQIQVAQDTTVECKLVQESSWQNEVTAIMESTSPS